MATSLLRSSTKTRYILGLLCRASESQSILGFLTELWVRGDSQAHVQLRAATLEGVSTPSINDDRTDAHHP